MIQKFNTLKTGDFSLCHKVLYKTNASVKLYPRGSTKTYFLSVIKLSSCPGIVLITTGAPFAQPIALSPRTQTISLPVVHSSPKASLFHRQSIVPSARCLNPIIHSLKPTLIVIFMSPPSSIFLSRTRP